MSGPAFTWTDVYEDLRRGYKPNLLTAGVALAIAAVGGAVWFATIGKQPLACWIGAFVYYVAGFTAYAAMLRRELGAFGGRREDLPTGFGGLQWGALEWRLAGVTGLAVLWMIALALVAAVVVTIAVLVLLLASGELTTKDSKLLQVATSLMPLALMAILWAAWAWASARFAFAAQATVVSGRVRLLKTGELTRGRFWFLFQLYLLCAAPSFVLSLAANALAAAGTATVTVQVVAILSPLAASVTMPAVAAVYCGLYRRLEPEVETADVFGPRPACA